MCETKSEEEILEGLEQRGIARPIPTYETAGDPCANPGCAESVPESSRTSLNLGLPDYCSLACRMDDEGENDA